MSLPAVASPAWLLRFATLPAVIDHYNRNFRLGLTEQEKGELIEYLKSRRPEGYDDAIGPQDGYTSASTPGGGIVIPVAAIDRLHSRPLHQENFMRTPASIAGHPIHPMLVPIPIGLWIFSLVCDLIHAGGSSNPAWATVAFYTMGGGIIGALLAAVPGLIDLLSLPPDPKKTALAHMAINLTVVALYAVNFWLRLPAPEQPGKLVWLSVIAIGLLVVSGWLGGKMVYVYGIAVDTPPDTTRR